MSYNKWDMKSIEKVKREAKLFCFNFNFKVALVQKISLTTALYMITNVTCDKFVLRYLSSHNQNDMTKVK